MTLQQLKLTQLLGEGRTKFEPDGGGYDFIELPDYPTIADFHRYANKNYIRFFQDMSHIEIFKDYNCFYSIPYDSDKDLINQTTETLDAIIELIDNHS